MPLPVIILVDDSVEGASYFSSRCRDEGFACLVTDDPDDLAAFPWRAHRPSQWPHTPANVAAIVLDLSLGEGRGHTVGGLRAAARYAQHIPRHIPLILRTDDLERERDLAAVLCAELLSGEKDEPLPWWSRHSLDDRGLFEFIRANQLGIVSASDYGGREIRTLFIDHRDDAGERRTWTLGRTLLGGSRWKLWQLMSQGRDAQTVAMYGTSKIVNDMRFAISALALMRLKEIRLHELDGLDDTETELEWEKVLGQRKRLPRQEHLGAIGEAYGSVLADEQTLRVFADAAAFRMNDLPAPEPAGDPST